MDHTEAQLHREIIHTREEIDDKLAELDERTRQKWQGLTSTMTDIIDYGVIARIREVQETSDRGRAVMHRYPWLIIVGGALLGYLFGLTRQVSYSSSHVNQVRIYRVAQQCPPAISP
jgi:hypothetical protein